MVIMQRKAALFVAALFLMGLTPAAHAASCCGGGGGSSMILPKFNHEMVGLSLDVEQYDGLWRKDGTWVPDPDGSDLNQYRLNFGYARRLGYNWQGSVNVPYVWNRNAYAGFERNTHGVGDTTVSVFYETFENVTCIYEVNNWRDLVPALYLGGGLVLPTGVSPYDSVEDNFDITGRGFYRLDATVLLEKTIFPWNFGIQGTYGRYLERDINREYGKYVEPYEKQLGDRTTTSVNFGYTWTTRKFHSWTATLAYSQLREEEATVDGAIDATTGLRKDSVAFTLAWSSVSKLWVVKGTFGHAPRENDWGANFPSTDIFTLGVNRVLW